MAAAPTGYEVSSIVFLRDVELYMFRDPHNFVLSVEELRPSRVFTRTLADGTEPGLEATFIDETGRVYQYAPSVDVPHGYLRLQYDDEIIDAALRRIHSQRVQGYLSIPAQGKGINHIFELFDEWQARIQELSGPKQPRYFEIDDISYSGVVAGEHWILTPLYNVLDEALQGMPSAYVIDRDGVKDSSNN